MGRTDEQPMPVEETYRDILRAAVREAGGQDRVAAMIGVDQATISRTLNPGRNAAYTTLMKLSRVLPGVPAPVVAVRDGMHERWCILGAVLASQMPEEFASLLSLAESAARHVQPNTKPAEATMEKLIATVRDPMPRRGERRVRG